MNVKYVAKFASSSFGAVSAVRALNKARHEDDRLRMIDAVLSAASAAIAVAILVRDIRSDQDAESRMTQLEED